MEIKPTSNNNPVATNTLLNGQVAGQSAVPSLPKITPAQATPVLRPLNQPRNENQVTKVQKGSSMKKPLLLIGVVLALLLGVGSGYGLAVTQKEDTNNPITKSETNLKREVTTEEIKPGTKVGIADEKAFRDTGEGVLEKGGIDGEGSHHIKRPGGESQTLYVTSSVIDLDQFNGRKVKVWGETFSGQKAGWLMDVGKLEVLE